MDDVFFMRKALDLASLGAGFTSPNPMVGAVIVKRGRIVGIGYHKKKGDKHAEIKAIEDAAGHLEGSTLYINLEPCVHYGATPPCAPVVAKAGIRRAVISNLDPNPLVQGKGVELLKNSGVEVEVGLLEEEGRFLNRFFFKYMQTGLPYLILKAALTLDGYIADLHGVSQWISGEDSREFVHRLRGEVDAVMVGKGTVIKDNPELTPRRIYAPKLPFRVIVAMKPFDSYDYKIFRNPEKLLIVTSERVKWELPDNIKNEIIIVKVEEQEGKLNLREALKKLGEIGIQSIICEGGSILFGELIRQKLPDELVIFYAPIILGEGLRVFSGFARDLGNPLKGFRVYETIKFKDDIMVRYLRYE
ncbi:MAG: bifunctional diaminohydroxyphosphoribosylaminopyrimidine deaminase/5-amino-6-(5-phosphoribosylamino)uracil reductase RibD [candidate division WOR-3 bacterium]